MHVHPQTSEKTTSKPCQASVQAWTRWKRPSVRHSAEVKGAKTARSLLNRSEDSTSHSAKGLQGSRESRFLGSRQGRPDKNMTVLEEGQTKYDPYQCPFPLVNRRI